MCPQTNRPRDEGKSLGRTEYSQGIELPAQRAVRQVSPDDAS